MALAATRAGYTVFLEDVMPSNLHHAQEQIRAELGPEALPSVRFVFTIEDAVRQADLVIDCVPDELESKLEILWLLDRMAPPRAVFATPTMRLSITDLAHCTYRESQCIAMEAEASALTKGRSSKIVLRRAPTTSDATAEMVSNFWQAIGFAVEVLAE
jgi:3-hydroxybutyryl-CoA dehydrogenase